MIYIEDISNQEKNAKGGTRNINGDIPVWHKVNLTVNEAVQYSNIGQNTLRKITDEPNCPFALFVGKKRLIKRKQFDEWLERQRYIG